MNFIIVSLLLLSLLLLLLYPDLFEELGEAFLSNIVTEDETPLSLYIPETKQQSASWTFPGEKLAVKLRSGTSHKNCLMLTIFWDKKGPIKGDFAGSKQRINSEYYPVRSLRRKPRNQQMWLLHDNAPIHTSQRTKEQIAPCGFSLVAHPPYRPDIAPSDFYLFKPLKNDLRGEKFDSLAQLQEKVSNLLASYSENFYEEGFQQLLTRWRKCKEALESYIVKEVPGRKFSFCTNEKHFIFVTYMNGSIQYIRMDEVLAFSRNEPKDLLGAPRTYASLHYLSKRAL